MTHLSYNQHNGFERDLSSKLMIPSDLNITLFQAFVSCVYGVSSLGYVMIVFGGAMSICSVLIGRLAKYTGHFIIVITGG